MLTRLIVNSWNAHEASGQTYFITRSTTCLWKTSNVGWERGVVSAGGVVRKGNLSGMWQIRRVSERRIDLDIWFKPRLLIVRIPTEEIRLIRLRSGMGRGLAREGNTQVAKLFGIEDLGFGCHHAVTRSIPPAGIFFDVKGWFPILNFQGWRRLLSLTETRRVGIAACTRAVQMGAQCGRIDAVMTIRGMPGNLEVWEGIISFSCIK